MNCNTTTLVTGQSWKYSLIYLITVYTYKICSYHDNMSQPGTSFTDILRTVPKIIFYLIPKTNSQARNQKYTIEKYQCYSIRL